MLYELFGKVKAFKGSLIEVFQTKQSLTESEIPPDFPVELKPFIVQGWTEGPHERPGLSDIGSVLGEMLACRESSSIFDQN